jgi:hypothetical protein
MKLPGKGKRVSVSVYWPDDWKEIILSPEDWEMILAGEEFCDCGAGYSYEGEEFLDTWHFAGGLDGELRVTYGEGGEGYIGTLDDGEVVIEEVEEDNPQ